MQWLILCLFACATTAAQELRCTSPACTEQPRDRDWQSFTINGGRLTISHKKIFILKCHGHPALESSALPRFPTEYQISNVEIEDCPLPTNLSIGAVLAALNIVLQPDPNGYTGLFLSGISDTEQLVAHHFSGLDKLTNLTIQPLSRTPKVGPRAFSDLINLRTLSLRYSGLDFEELYHLPRTLVDLGLAGVSIKPLAGSLPVVFGKTARAIPQLRKLSLEPNDFITGDSISSNETELQESENIESSLEVVTLNMWQEIQLSALVRCERLRKFELLLSDVEEMPDRFVAACPHLEELVIDHAKELRNLPAKFLEGATRLKSLRIRRTDIETLPAELFQSTHKLVSLDLSDNKLTELPSGVFVGLPLEFLSMSKNHLSEDALNEVATLTSITELRLVKNNFPNICGGSGYSPLRNLTKLKVLDLSRSGVGQICRDWRENMIYLEHLDLYGGNIRDLHYNDLQYIRDPSVENAKVLLKASARMNFSEDDYKKALTAPATAALVTFEDRDLAFASALSQYFNSATRYQGQFPTCDCTTFWFRKAMDDARQAVRTEGYTCRGGKLLKDMKTEEFFPGSVRV